MEKNYLWTDAKRSVIGFKWPLSSTRYALTNKKVILKLGILNVEEREIDLYKIVDKRIVLPLIPRIFGCGTIHIQSMDKDLPNLTLKNIKNPRKVYDLLEDLASGERSKFGVSGRDMAGALDHGHCSEDGEDAMVAGSAKDALRSALGK